MKHILTIEDDQIWNLKLQAMLDDFEPCIVRHAETLEIARQYLNKYSFDLILCDVVLPDGLGTSFFKNNPPQCPTIMMTSFNDYDFYKDAINTPYCTFLLKPFKSLTLYATIETLKRSIDKIVIQKSKLGISVIGKYGKRETIHSEDIYLVSVEANYSFIHTDTHKHALKLSLTKLKEKLNDNFVQVHKSTIINADYIQRVNMREGFITVKNENVPIGRAFQKPLLQFLNNRKSIP